MPSPKKLSNTFSTAWGLWVHPHLLPDAEYLHKAGCCQAEPLPTVGHGRGVGGAGAGSAAQWPLGGHQTCLVAGRRKAQRHWHRGVTPGKRADPAAARWLPP